MKLFLLRHAHAEDAQDDHARPVSEKGRVQCESLGRFCRKAGLEFDAVYASPLVRARQTAELVCGITNRKDPVEVQIAKALMNEARPVDFRHWLESLGRVNCVLAVGHAPSLAERARHLLGMREAESLSLPKGGLICLEMHGSSRASLLFYISPKLLI